MEANPSQNVYIIRKGLVKTYKSLPGGKQQILELLKKEDFLHLTSLFDLYCNHSSETVVDSELCAIDKNLLEKLLKKNAIDILLAPVHMKKGRPGFVLTVLTDHAHAEDLKKIILAETSPIGLRFHVENRLTLPREIVEIETKWGRMKAKKIDSGNSVTITPEYEECRRVANQHNIAISDVYTEMYRLTGRK